MLLSELTSFIDANRYKGRGEAFGWTDDELITYLHWADTFQYLFVESDENGFTGVAIMYPLSTSFNGNPDELYNFSNPQETEQNDLCIMDFISINNKAKKDLVNQLKERYPNWEAQNKWALRFGVPRKITNKYINLLNN